MNLLRIGTVIPWLESPNRYPMRVRLERAARVAAVAPWSQVRDARSEPFVSFRGSKES
jgi:hypothetical protein